MRFAAYAGPLRYRLGAVRPAPAVPPLAVAAALTLGVILLVIPEPMFTTGSAWLLSCTTAALLFGLWCYHRWAAGIAGDNVWTAAAPLLLGYFFLRFGIGALIIYYWDKFPWEAMPLLRMKYFIHGARQNLGVGCRLAMLGGLGLSLGMMLPVRRAVAALPHIHWPVDFVKLRRNLTLYAPVAVSCIFIAKKLPAGVQFLVLLFGTVTYVFIIIAGYWAFSRSNAVDRLNWAALGGGICAASVPFGLITGQIADCLFPVIMFAFGYVLARGRLPWKPLLLVGPVAVFTLAPFLTVYKHTTQETSADSIKERFWITTERMKALGGRAQFEMVLDRFVARLSAMELPAIFSRYYPDVYPYAAGRSFWVEFSNLVPRFMWTDKPDMAPELDKYSLSVGVIGLSDTHTSAVFDAVSEYHVNFGPVGVFILCIAHGAYLKALYSWLASNFEKPIGHAIFAVLFVLNMDSFGVGQLIVNHVKTLPVWALLIYLLSSKTIWQRI